MIARKRVISTRVDDRQGAVCDAAAIMAGYSTLADWLRAACVAEAARVLGRQVAEMTAGGMEPQP